MTVQHRSEETRARILAVAADCFARHGYEATGVAEICEAAGVSKGAFYHHFPTKQALFLELLGFWLNALDEDFNAARAGTATVPEALQRMASMMGPIFREQGGQLPIFLEFWTQAAHDPTVWQPTVSYYRRYQEYFAGLIQAGIDEGSFRATGAGQAARVLVSFAIGLLLQGLLDPQGNDWGATAEEGIRMFLASLRA